MSAPAQQFDPESAQFGSSRTQKRLEDDRLLVGAGLFSDDRQFENEAALVVVRAPHAHARISATDLAAARAAPGVLGVWSMDDLKTDGVGFIPVPTMFKRADGTPMVVPPRFPLADGTVFYVGQPVVAVVAETRMQAQDAAELVEVSYQELPAVVDAKQAVEAGAVQLFPGADGNVAAEARMGDAKATDEAFARAAHVTELELFNQRLIVNPIEPRCCIGAVDDGRTTLYTQNQTPTGARQLLSDVFKGKPEDFRVVIGDIGGGFGMKTGLGQEDALVCHAARKLGRPVRWRAERSEDFLGAHMGRDQHFKAQLALDAEGKFLALRMRSLGNVGAPTVGSSLIIPLMIGPRVQTSVYHMPVVDYHIRAVLTNTMATGAYRGAGRPEANYLMERLVQKAAAEMNIDPVELRRRNLIPPSAFPYRTPIGQTYDSGNFAKMLDQVLELSDWQGFPARKADSAARGRLRGRGLAVYIEWTGAVPTETITIKVEASGEVTVFTGTQAMGQGTETSFAQLAAEILQLDIARIRIVQGDTDQATGQGSVGSRSAFVGGSALVSAGRKVLGQGKELAAQALEAALQDVEYSEGQFRVSGTDRSIGFFALAEKQPGRAIAMAATETAAGASWPNGAQVCEVEIDPDTGAVTVVRHSSVDDIGRIINRMIVTGQVQGGIAQGIGQALMEQAVYDPLSGQLLTGSLADYALPRADDFGPMANAFDESVPCKTNLLGVKGVGEIGTIGAVPAAVHAVLDALSAQGVRHIEMPITSEKVWRLLKAA